MHTMLQQATVARLAISCVKTVLEHCRLDVVPLVLLFRRKTLDLLPQFECLYIFLLKISPPIFAVPGNSPTVEFALLCDGFDGLKCSSCRFFSHGEFVAVMEEKLPAATALHFAGLELHVVMFCREVSVLRTLVGSVGIDGLDLCSGHFLAVGHGLLKHVAVCLGGSLCLHGCYDARLAFLNGLRDIGDVSRYLLVVLVAKGSVLVIRALEAVGGDLLFVTESYLALFRHLVLVIENSPENVNVSGSVAIKRQDGVDERPDNTQAVLQNIQSY